MSTQIYPNISDNAICKLVCTTKPENATHWTCAAIGKKCNISANSVSIILRERKLKPHPVQSFQFSNDKHFDEKLDDVVGLYLDPPENAIVFCVDEKTQRLSSGKNTADTAYM